MIATFYVIRKNGYSEKCNICVAGSATFYKLIEMYTREYTRGYVKGDNGKTLFKWGWND